MSREIIHRMSQRIYFQICKYNPLTSPTTCWFSWKLWRNVFGTYEDFGRYKLEVGLENKYRDNEDPKRELKRDIEKYIPRYLSITCFPYLFNVEEKVDIKPYQFNIDFIDLY